jgi:hypothetical protein
LTHIKTHLLVRIKTRILAQVETQVSIHVLLRIMARVLVQILVRIMTRVLARVSIPVLALVIALASAAAQPHQAWQSVPSMSSVVTATPHAATASATEVVSEWLIVPVFNALRNTECPGIFTGTSFLNRTEVLTFAENPLISGKWNGQRKIEGRIRHADFLLVPHHRGPAH